MTYDDLKNLSKIDQVKSLLKEEQSQGLSIIPILHNKDVIILQLCGWSINLYSNGLWIWEDTTGG